MNPLNPYDKPSQEPGSIIADVPSAYRAWAQWAGRANVGCLQVATIHDARGQLTQEQITIALAEVLSRATLEVFIGIEFSGTDSSVDVAVHHLIMDLFGAPMADAVRLSVALAGPCRWDREFRGLALVRSGPRSA